MRSFQFLDSTASIQALVFDIPEVKASGSMGTTTAQCCANLGIAFTSMDVWTNPEAVLTHRILVGPTIVLLADGEEIARLAGPRNCRQVKRFFDKAIGTRQATVVAA